MSLGNNPIVVSARLGCLRRFDKLRVAPSMVEGPLRSGQESADVPHDDSRDLH